MPRTRVLYLADSTDLSSSNTAPSFSFNLAVEKSVDSLLLFLFSFFFSLMVLPSTPVSSLFSFLRLSLSFIFFLPICLSIYLDSFPRLFASLFRGFFAWLVLVNELPYSFEHGQRLHEYASRWPRPTGGCWWKVTCWPEIASSRGIWYPVYQWARGMRDGRVLEIEFDLRFGNFFEVDSATSFRIGKLGSREDFGLGFEEFPIGDRCYVIT